ncbi:hypothetical protein BGZ46_009341 [Entomortierella lignicola]|nr:hypothetical protein BGZ46_009341 [Entomortierella lignicola]
MYAHSKSPRMLRTVSQLMPDTFSDFIGEVCYFKPEFSYSGNKAVMAMTDYTQHEKLPFQEGHGKVNGKATILVTLWDEHLQTALDLNVGVGQFLYLQNMLCKLNKNDTIELRMNGFRPGKGYHITEPIKVLDQKDPAAIELRMRQIKYRQSQEQSNKENIRSRSDIVPSVSTLSDKSKPAPVPAPVPASASASAPQTSFEPTTLKKEDESPKKPQISSIKRQASKTPSPADSPSLHVSSSPTRVLLERIHQERRNHKGVGIQYIRLQASVTDFAPKQIIDFSVANCHICNYRCSPLSDSKLPTRCPICKKGNTFIFKYYFMLTVVDELQQVYKVHVDNDGARTLLGPTLENAGNFNKHLERFEDLKIKLARIGVIEGNPAQENPIYFDCCIRLTGVQPHRSVSPDAEYYVGLGDEDLQYSGDDLDKNEVTHYSGMSTQPAEVSSQKRRATDDLNENRKRLNRNTIEDITSDQGLILEGSENDKAADFRATLVHTVIN